MYHNETTQRLNAFKLLSNLIDSFSGSSENGWNVEVVAARELIRDRVNGQEDGQAQIVEWTVTVRWRLKLQLANYLIVDYLGGDRLVSLLFELNVEYCANVGEGGEKKLSHSQLVQVDYLIPLLNLVKETIPLSDLM